MTDLLFEMVDSGQGLQCRVNNCDEYATVRGRTGAQLLVYIGYYLKAETEMRRDEYLLNGAFTDYERVRAVNRFEFDLVQCHRCGGGRSRLSKNDDSTLSVVCHDCATTREIRNEELNDVLRGHVHGDQKNAILTLGEFTADAAHAPSRLNTTDVSFCLMLPYSIVLQPYECKLLDMELEVLIPPNHVACVHALHSFKSRYSVTQQMLCGRAFVRINVVNASEELVLRKNTAVARLLLLPCPPVQLSLMTDTGSDDSG